MMCGFMNVTDHPEIPDLSRNLGLGNTYMILKCIITKFMVQGIYTGHFYIIDASDKTNPTTILSHS